MRHGTIKLILLALALALGVLAQGCSLWERPLMYDVVGQSADLGTSAYALCVSSNFVELNPTVRGDTCTDTMIQMVLFKAALIGAIELFCPNEGGCPVAHKVAGTFGFAAATWNASQILRVEAQ